MLNLEWLIAPHTVEEFMQQYWELKPLLVSRKSKNYYSNLLNIRDAENLLTSAGLRYPSVRLVKQGYNIPLIDYAFDKPLGSSTLTGLIRPDKVLAEFANGATIVFQGLHRNWPPLSKFCRSLEQQLEYRFQTNIYLTPPGAQGFAAHYDTHDVFVIQLEGSKHWRLYDSPVLLPSRHQKYSAQSGLTYKLLFETELTAGDLLYIPRGFVHEAATSDSSSMHITLGMTTYSWADVLVSASKTCWDIEDFRRSLPIGFANADNMPSISRAIFLNLVEKWLDHIDVEVIISNLANDFVASGLPLLDDQISQLSRLRTISIDTVVTKRPTLLYRLSVDDSEVTLVLPGKKIILPRFVEAAISHMLSNENFSVGAICSNIDDEGKKTLVARLVREGVLLVT